jgi:murein DD-endopeptidase MepM/ murein hydrolase activator NlpD
MSSSRPRSHVVSLVLSLLFFVGFQGQSALDAVAANGQRGGLGATAVSGAMAASFPLAAPAYYRPVILDGRSFPVARSNFLSILEFPNNWHAPRLRLINGRWLLVGLHLGIDIIAERGTPILAMERGVVENVGWTFYSGTRVGVQGVDGRYYLYAHLSDVQPGVVPGAKVAAGAVLGRVGNTGYGPPGHRDEFPPHLHFGIEAASGGWVNPYGTLVRLYRAAVAGTSRKQSVLDRLAGSGKRTAWSRQAERTYMRLNPPGGE